MSIEIHRVPAERGVAWFTRSLELAGRRPGVLLGALGLQLLLLFGVVMALLIVGVALAIVARSTGADMTQAGRGIGVVGGVLFAAIIQPVMIAGFLHVLREVDEGRAVRARDVFAPLGGGRLMAIASLGLVQLVATALNFGTMAAFGGPEYLHDYIEFISTAMQGQLSAEPVAEHAALMFVAQLIVGYFAFSAQAYAAALIQFQNAPAWPAVLASLRAASINVLPMTLAGLLLSLGLIGGVIVAALLIVLVSMLLGLVSKLLAGVVAIALFAFVMAMMFALMFSGVLLSWRDMFAPGAEKAAAPATMSAEM